MQKRLALLYAILLPMLLSLTACGDDEPIPQRTEADAQRINELRSSGLTVVDVYGDRIKNTPPVDTRYQSLYYVVRGDGGEVCINCAIPSSILEWNVFTIHPKNNTYMPFGRSEWCVLGVSELHPAILEAHGLWVPRSFKIEHELFELDSTDPYKIKIKLASNYCNEDLICGVLVGCGYTTESSSILGPGKDRLKSHNGFNIKNFNLIVVQQPPIGRDPIPGLPDFCRARETSANPFLGLNTIWPE